MSERTFRLIQGIYLILFLSLDLSMFIYAIIITMGLEGLTNWRIPRIVSRLRYGKQAQFQSVRNDGVRFNLDSEQMQRLAMAIFLLLTYIVFPGVGWYGPWFLGFLLIMAGLTNICPMVIFMRWIGCK